MRYTYADKKFFNSLFLFEVMSENCKKQGCLQKRIRNSSMCRVHHFEMIKGKPCSWDQPVQLPVWPFRRIVKTFFIIIGITISIFLTGCVVTSFWISLESLRSFGLSVFYLALAFVFVFVGAWILKRLEEKGGSMLIEGVFGAALVSLGGVSFIYSIISLIDGVRQLIYALTT
jgi:hypothetical protein